MANYLKFLAKLTARKRDVINLLVDRIIDGDLLGLSVKKLSGFDHLYRVKRGRIRIVFRKIGSKNVIINVAYRKSIYRDL